MPGCKRRISDHHLRQGTPAHLKYYVGPSHGLSFPLMLWAWRFANVWRIFPWYASNWTAQQVTTTILISEQVAQSFKKFNSPLSWTTRAQKCEKPYSSDFVRWLGIPIADWWLEINHSRTSRTSGCNFSSINLSRHLSQAVMINVRRRRASLRW